jgi:hypothetical protein
MFKKFTLLILTVVLTATICIGQQQPNGFYKLPATPSEPMIVAVGGGYIFCACRENYPERKTIYYRHIWDKTDPWETLVRHIAGEDPYPAICDQVYATENNHIIYHAPDGWIFQGSVASMCHYIENFNSMNIIDADFHHYHPGIWPNFPYVYGYGNITYLRDGLKWQSFVDNTLPLNEQPWDVLLWEYICGEYLINIYNQEGSDWHLIGHYLPTREFYSGVQVAKKLNQPLTKIIFTYKNNQPAKPFALSSYGELFRGNDREMATKLTPDALWSCKELHVLSVDKNLAGIMAYIKDNYGEVRVYVGEFNNP